MTDTEKPADVPWYAVALGPDERYPALRPVREDEIEELDEIGPWEEDAAREAAAAEAVTAARRTSGGAPKIGVTAGATDATHDAVELVAVAIGRALRTRRWELGMSQGAYAAATGRSQGTVSMLERGRNPLTVVDLVRIARETGRAIRVDIVPDGAPREELGRVEATRLGDVGAVHVAVGPPPPPGAVGGGRSSDRWLDEAIP